MNRLTKPIGKLGRIALIFFVVMFGWVLFRAEDLAQASNYYSAMFSFEFSNVYLFVSAKFYRVLAMAIALSFLLYFDRITIGCDRFVDSIGFSNQLIKTFVGVFLIVVSVANLAGSGFNPFIYFRF
ncbi:hypothetical protein N9Q47_00895 [Vicingaceae bacterium]|nr:hypothetical protein [Vicingaceae bacterium]